MMVRRAETSKRCRVVREKGKKRVHGCDNDNSSQNDKKDWLKWRYCFETAFLLDSRRELGGTRGSSSGLRQVGAVLLPSASPEHTVLAYQMATVIGQ